MMARARHTGGRAGDGPASKAARSWWPGAAEPGDREPRPFAASALAPGQPVPGDRQVPRADVAFHPDPVAGTRCWHERRTRAMPGSGSPGIWPVFPPAADVGGIAGPVPAKTCGQATVSLTWMPGRRARRPGGQLEPRRRAVLPWPQAEPAEPLAEPADADPAADSAVQRGPARPMPSRSGRPGSGRAGRLARWDFHRKRCRHALMPMTGRSLIASGL